MKELYAVLYFLGEIIGTVGPLPYDEITCAVRTEALMQDTRRIMGQHKELDARDFSAKCEWHAVRPKNGR